MWETHGTSTCEELWERVCTMGLASIRLDRTTKMPVVNLGKAKSTQVVTVAGGLNAAPGVTEVNRSALRAATRLEY